MGPYAAYTIFRPVILASLPDAVNKGPFFMIFNYPWRPEPFRLIRVLQNDARSRV